MFRKFCLLALVALASMSAKVASAAPLNDYPSFYWTITPSLDVTNAGSTSTITVEGTIFNNGNTDITSGAFAEAVLATPLSNFASAVFGTTGDASLQAELNDIDIAPGDSLNFDFATITLTGPAAGVYDLFSSDLLQVRFGNDPGDPMSGQVPPDGGSNPDPTLTVNPVPEPSSLALLATGAAGVLAMARRRFLTA